MLDFSLFIISLLYYYATNYVNILFESNEKKYKCISYVVIDIDKLSI